MPLEFGDSFGSNETASIEGVWVSLGGDAEILVSRLGNPEAQAAYRRIPRITRRQIEDSTMTNEQSDAFLADFKHDRDSEGADLFQRAMIDLAADTRQHIG